MTEYDIINSAISGRIMHALLISGPDGSGRFELARRIAAAFLFEKENLIREERLLNCPDYHEINQQIIGVGTIREMEDSCAAQAFNQGRRVFLIRNGHRMTASAQNALLKTLEEPPENTLILITGNEVGLLPTICSRCAVWKKGASAIPDTAERLRKNGISDQMAEIAAAYSDGLPEYAKRLCESGFFEFRGKAVQLLEEALFGEIPFAGCANLLKQGFVFSENDSVLPAVDTARESERETESDGEIQAKKSAKSNAPMLMDIFSSFLRDSLIAGEESVKRMNPDYVELTERIGQNFTKKNILDMIEKVLDIRKALAFNMQTAAAMDSVLTFMLAVREGKTI